MLVSDPCAERVNPLRGWERRLKTLARYAFRPVRSTEDEFMRCRFANPLVAGIVAACITLSGCFILIDALFVSNSVLDFGLNELPMFIQVWNGNTEAGTLTIAVTTSAPWILTDLDEVVSQAPSGTGALDKQTVRVQIDRRGLAAGNYEGWVRFSAPGVKSVEVTVRAQQDQDSVVGALNITNPTYAYSKPYLIDFQFALEDALGDPVVAEPDEFVINALEGSKIVTADTGLHLRRSAARQLRIDLVLDYSLSMQQIPGAIAAMEDAAKNIFLPALNTDALVGILEFHRDDQAAARVAQFTVERDILRQRIDSIQADFVHGFYSGSRTWDALMQSLDEFSLLGGAQEDRYILLFSNGSDTSSTATRNQVVAKAILRGVHVLAVGFGLSVDEGSLIDLTQRTGGAYFPSGSVGALDDAFQQIVYGLGAQYTLRWATLQRSGSFKPSFTISLDGAADTYTADDSYVISQYADSVVQGRLRVVSSFVENRATAFLRADYMPRFIYSMSVFVRSSLPFTVEVVDADNDGLLSKWTKKVVDDPVNNGKWIDVTSPGPPIPFATFGPLLLFNFGQVPDTVTSLFDLVTVDNTLYQQTGQSFVVEGFEGTTAPVHP